MRKNGETLLSRSERRHLFPVCIAFLSLAAILNSLSSVAWSADHARPNVLFIYVEDFGYYTSERATREPQAKINGLKTPNLDALAAQSIVFTRAFCGQTVCPPSKGAIYSGLLRLASTWLNTTRAFATSMTSLGTF